MLLCRRDGLSVSRVRVTRDTGAGIIGKNSLEAHAHLGRSVGDDHLTSVKRVADPDSPAVME